MNHPWLEIPIADYEAHMSLASVGQAELLRTALDRTVARFQPRSLARSAFGKVLSLRRLPAPRSHT